MRRAVLYARVSSDLQRKEGTIESQVVELKRQIAEAGNELVREYVDDGYTGTAMDRPGLEQLRKDVKTHIFDAIYFLCADRIAREVTYQNIIIGELLKHGKQIIINGQDYVYNPENKFTLTVLGAVAELERAKIIERMTRGKLHRLRQGQIVSHGHCTYGYEYVRKSPLSPPALAVNEREATVVRSIFEMYASGTAGPYRIPRLLEERGIPTRKGKTLWRACQVRYMLKNHTYAGTRYFNTMTYVQDEPGDPHATRRPRTIYRDQTEWIGVAVPAIVSQELFDAVQERLRQTERRYRHPLTHHLLGGLVQCGECGAGYSSYRRYVTKELVIRKRRVYHKAAYKCNWRTSQHMHARALIQRCHNSEIATHLLEEKVFEMIRYSLLDPVSLCACMDDVRGADRPDYRDAQRQFRRIERRIAAVESEKQQLIDRYASDQLSEEHYVDGNVSLDGELQRLKRKRATLLQLSLDQEAVDESVQEFCDGAKARFQKCTDFESKRRFILDHVEKVVYERYKVILYGSVPVRETSHEGAAQSGELRTLPFRFESDIDRTTLHSGSRQKFPDDGRLSRYMPTGVVLAEVAAPGSA